MLSTRLDTSNYESDRPLPKTKIRLTKYELSEKIMVQFAASRPKTYNNSKDNNDEDKNQNVQKSVP